MSNDNLARVYRILIASPSDVQEEREIAKDVICQWNSDNLSESGIVLIPTMWETDVLPGIEDDPQSMITRQIVDECDFAIAIFWTRLGSPTKKERSGTVEEIRRTLDRKKHVLVGFNRADGDLSLVDPEQLAALRRYESELKEKGLIFNFPTKDRFRYELSRHLSKITSKISDAPQHQRFSYKKSEEPSSYDVKQDMERLSIQARINHDADMLVINKAISSIQNVKTEEISVLDVGCGYGHVTKMRFGNVPGCKVLAVDYSKEAISVAQSMNVSSNIEYKVMDYRMIDEATGNFDIVFCAQFLQHTGTPETALHKLWKRVKPNGYIIARNSDDGADIIFPFNKELEKLIEDTDTVRGASDRLYGRKLYTHLMGLSPSPKNTNIHFNVLSTVGLAAKERKDFFMENHSFRLKYFKELAEKSNASAEEVKRFHEFERTYMRSEKEYMKRDDIFEAAVQFIGYAQKPDDSG